MIDRGKLNVLGVRIDAVDYDAALQRIIEAAEANRPLAASALAVHGVMLGVLDPEHRYRLNALDLLVPDGQPVRWALNLVHRAGLADRVYGPALMLKLCDRAAKERIPLFFYGSTPKTLAALQENLRRRLPLLSIAGALPSRFRCLSAAERDEIVGTIKSSGAKITLVGLGCPRQEVWAYEFRAALSMPLLSVGAAFDFHAGTFPQAPRLLQDGGLEWFYRLVQEPQRLWRRYLLLNPLYLGLLGLQLAGLRTFDPAGTRPAKRILYG